MTLYYILMILSALRKAMEKAGISIYVLPRTDQYQSQYITPSDQRISYISNFTGSNALGLISKTESLLWTDSRYYLQASQQLRSPWVMKEMEKGKPRWFEHIVNIYKQEDIIGIDAKLITHENGKARLKYFDEKGFKLKFLNHNLVNEIWQSKPKEEHRDIFVHERYAGVSALQKLKWIREKMQEKSAEGCIITDLSEICWILNVRSSEIPFNPFMKATLLVYKDKSQLYLPHQHPSLATPSQELDAHLKSINVKIVSYPIQFESLPSSILTKDSNYYIYTQLKNPIDWQGIGLQRARRPLKEQQGFRNCHVRDGVAMAMFWSKRSKMERIGEYQAAQMINQERLKQDLNQGLSFETISAGGPNGAIVHYRPSQKNDFQITKNMIHLVDSGGQYLDGTTDVTRAFHFGTPTKQQKDAYTRVLLGNLDIERLKWPMNFGIKGSHIDVLARRRLWDKGLNYGHGTGHGVGYFGGVHQSPVGISHLNNTVLEEGMVTSNQPGYYKSNGFGIRIQNLLLVVKDATHQQYLAFQCLTLCPYDLNLIDTDLLGKEDIEHINKYHQRCWDVLSPLITDKDCLDWLRSNTRRIGQRSLPTINL